jgi:predicted dienelactone hydrolase
MKNFVWLLLLLSAFSCAKNSAPHVAVAGRDVAFWQPAGAAPAAGYPLIVFSHGYTGCNTQSVFLMEALARAGYFVVAPNHKDARCGTARGTWYPGKMLANRPQAPFRDVDKWNEETYKDRREDIEAVLDGVLRDGSFQGVPIDRNRIGIAGHSLGGYTALALAGGWPSWKDNRIKAVLALSPHCSPFVAKGDLPHLNVPVMYQGGTRDFGETPVVRRAGGAYELSSSPKYYVELDGAGHFAWTDLNKSYQETIDEYSVAFFDRYLKPSGSDALGRLIKTPSKDVSAAMSDPK